MATGYTSILKLALPVSGELSGTWGDVVNDNITEMVEEAAPRHLTARQRTVLCDLARLFVFRDEVE